MYFFTLANHTWSRQAGLEEVGYCILISSSCFPFHIQCLYIKTSRTLVVAATRTVIICQELPDINSSPNSFLTSLINKFLFILQKAKLLYNMPCCELGINVASAPRAICSDIGITILFKHLSYLSDFKLFFKGGKWIVYLCISCVSCNVWHTQTEVSLLKDSIPYSSTIFQL